MRPHRGKTPNPGAIAGGGGLRDVPEGRGVTFTERLLELSRTLNYRAPDLRKLTDHAIRRWRERWRPNAKMGDARRELLALIPLAVIVRIVGSERCSTWELPEGAKLVVFCDGTIKTVLPRGAAPPDRRPRK